MMIKRIFNQDKSCELTEDQIDVYLGKLIDEKLFIAHHEAIAEVKEQSHDEVIEVYENGGQDIATIIDVPYSEGREAYDEYEDILVYIQYTGEELVQGQERKYKAKVETAIREKYSVSDELGIHRQKEVKPDEWAEYVTYCENCKALSRVEVYGD